MGQQTQLPFVRLCICYWPTQCECAGPDSKRGADVFHFCSGGRRRRFLVLLEKITKQAVRVRISKRHRLGGEILELSAGVRCSGT